MTLLSEMTLDNLSPIMSVYDTRLVTLVGVAIELIGENALLTGKSPETILAEAMYMTNKHVHSQGEEKYMNKLHLSYPLLAEAIR